MSFLSTFMSSRVWTRPAPLSYSSDIKCQFRVLPRVIPAARPAAEAGEPLDDHGRPSPALRPQAFAAEKPGDDQRARTGLCRGRRAEGAIPRLPRGARARRHRADHDRRLGVGLARQPARVQQHRRVEGRGRSVDARSGRFLPRKRLRGDDPAHPSRPAHALEQWRLAAGRLALACARAGASRVPEKDRGLGHRADHQRLCGRGRAHEGVRARRHRTAGLWAPDGQLLVAAHQ